MLQNRLLLAVQALGGGRLRRIGCHAVPYLVLVAFWVAHNSVAERWDLYWLVSQAWTELPLILLSYAGLRLFMRPSALSSLAAALPLALVYVAHDYYQLMALRPADWNDGPLILQLLPSLTVRQWLWLVSFVALPLLFCLWRLDLRAFVSRRLLILVVPAFVISAIELLPEQVTQAAVEKLELGGWSDVYEVACRGRLAMSLVREARRRQAVLRLRSFRPLEAANLWRPPSFTQTLAHRNTIVVLLEGFFDPRRFSALRFNRPPLHDEFLKRVGANLSSSISPAFGSGTGRAAFEMLCGVPALSLVGSEEFDVLTGAPTYCLPNVLRGAGYATTVFDLGGPRYYNAVRAYESLGFAHVLFPDEDVHDGTPAIDTSAKATQWLFDGKLYEQVLAQLRTAVAHDQTVFYFVITMYGHIPFELEPDAQPTVVGVTRGPVETAVAAVRSPGSANRGNRAKQSNPTAPSPLAAEPLLEVMANQSYYRSKAIIDFVDGVMAVDPQAMVVFVADHAPPLPRGEQDYARLAFDGGGLSAADPRLYQVPLVVHDRRAFVKTPLIHHFDIPALVLDRLSDGHYCGDKRCAFSDPDVDLEDYTEDYRTIVGLGARPRL